MVRWGFCGSFCYLFSLLDITFIHKRDFVRVTWLFCQKEKKKCVKMVSLYLFWRFERREKEQRWKKNEFFDQRLKGLFLSNLSSWTKLYILESSMFLFDFIYWLNSLQGRTIMLSFFLSSFDNHRIGIGHVYFNMILLFNTIFIYL